MAGEYYKVTEFVRGVVDGRVVVRRPGARIPIALAIQLGLLEQPPAEQQAAGAKGTRKPRRPAGATLPASRPARRR